MDASGRPLTGQVILLATSSAVTAILYAIYRQKSKAVHSLKGARKVSLDQNLKSILMEAPGKCVPYAVIEENKESSCQAQVCECDREASLCLRREAHTYNKFFHHYPTVLCKEATPKCPHVKGAASEENLTQGPLRKQIFP